MSYFQFKSHFIHTERIIKKTIFSEMSQRLTVTNNTIGKLKKELLGKIKNLKINLEWETCLNLLRFSTDTKTKVGTLTSELKGF